MTRAFYSLGGGRGEVRSEALAAPREGEALVRTRVSGVSRGTEALVFAGRVPASVSADMRAPFQVGDFGAAVKYGYAAVGVVEQGPADLLGRRVFCLHPHQDRFVVPAAALHVVPEGVPDRRAPLAAHVETALNALWDGAAGPGDRIAVVGAGSVGLCCALLAARMPGATVQVIDVSTPRRALAAAAGLDARSITDAQGGCDLVIHASGRPAGLATAIALAGVEATVLELSWYGEGDIPVPLGAHFHSRRLRLQSSQVGMVAPSRRPRWTHARRLGMALSLLTDERFDRLLPVVGAEIPFAELPARFPALAAGGGEGPPMPLVVY